MTSRHVETATDVGFIVAIWRDKPDARPFILPDGEAERFRALTRARLRCAMADCPSPELTTVARRNAYHHFRHLSGTQHAPESVHHINGKAVLADRISTARPDLQVDIEWAVSAQRERVADVAVYDPRSERRYAFEVQYSPLSLEQWRARTRDYVERGIEPTWFFGHSGAQFRQARGVSSEKNAVRLNQLQRAVAKEHGMVHWLNPVRRMIGTAVQRRNAKTPTARLHIEPLEALDFQEAGVVTPLWRLAREEMKQRAAWDAVRDSLSARDLAELHQKREEAERERKEAQLAQFGLDIAEMNARIDRRKAEPDRD